MAYYELNEQELGRRESLKQLRQLGINPYPAPLYPVNATTAEIAAGFKNQRGGVEGGGQWDKLNNLRNQRPVTGHKPDAAVDGFR